MRRFTTPSTSTILSVVANAINKVNNNNNKTSSSSSFLQDTMILSKRFQGTVAAPETVISNGATTTSSIPHQVQPPKPQVSTTTTNTTTQQQVVKPATAQQQQGEAPAAAATAASTSTITLGFLGCGNMSAAILKGLVKAAALCPKVSSEAEQQQQQAAAAATAAGGTAPLSPGEGNNFFRNLGRILIFDPSIKPGTKKAENFHINLKKMNPNMTFEILDSAEELAERSSVAVIGVKPQVARTVLHPLRGHWGKKTASATSIERPTVIISVIAGETILSLEEMLQPPEFTERIRREEELALKQIALDDQIDSNDELMASNPDLASAAEFDEKLNKGSPSEQENSASSEQIQQQQQQQQQYFHGLAPLEPSHLCVVRSMPNTPLLVGKGVSGYSISTDNLQRAVGATTDQAIPKVTEKFIHDATSAILGSAQNTLAFVPEGQLDAVSGVSGCGPAFVSMVVESLADGGVMQGLPRALANRLAAETVHGASAMLCGDKPAISSAAEMRHQVCSPGGATIAGVHKLEEKGLRDALMCAVSESATRCGELRREGEQQATILRKKQRVAAIKKKKHSQYVALQKSQVKKRSGSGGRPRSPGSKK